MVHGSGHAGRGPPEILNPIRGESMLSMSRREFILLIGSAATAWPLESRVEEARMPVVDSSPAGRSILAVRKGLNEDGSVEGQNVAVEYHWVEANTMDLASLMADRPTPAHAFRRAREAHIETYSIEVRWRLGVDDIASVGAIIVVSTGRIGSVLSFSATRKR
jgi:hypothetical protein